MNRIALLLGACLVPVTAMAQSYNAPRVPTAEPGYDYIQADYLADGDMRGVSRDYGGYGIEASTDLAPNVFVHGRYDRLITDGSGSNVNRASLGIGFHDFYDYGGPRGTGMGYYGTVSYERLGLRDFVGSRDATGTGFGLNAGLRWLVDPRIEINPSLGYVDFANISGDRLNYGSPDGWRYGVRVLGTVTDGFALSAEYAKTDYDIGRRSIDFTNEVRVGARLTF